MRPSKENVLTYFSDVCSHYATYHNHKETSAWGAVALYLIVVIQVAGTMGSGVAEPERVGRAVVIVLLGIALSRYLLRQFALRELSANIQAACMALHTEYLSADETTIDENLFTLVDRTDAKSHSVLILANIILDKMDYFSSRGQEMRKSLERMMYFSLALVTIGGLAMVFTK